MAQISLFKIPSLSKKTFKDTVKTAISGISGSFMLPISTLAVVSVFLVVGAFIQSLQTPGSLGFGGFIKSLAFPLIQAIPLLFCVSFAFSFCKGESLYVWTAILSYFVFLSVQHVCISTEVGNGANVGNNGEISKITGYKVLFSGSGRSPSSMLSLVDKTLGFTSLNTSLFGPLVIGGYIIPKIQKKYSSITFPDPFSFFSGKRFVPFVSSVFSAIFGLFCLFFYPWIGTAFGKLGNALSKTPVGLDSFIFGFLEKALIPFGFHHMFYSPFWYSSIGGDLIRALNENISVTDNFEMKVGSEGAKNSVVKSVDVLNNPTNATESLLSLYSGARASSGMWSGDAMIGVSAISLPSNRVKLESNTTVPVLEFIHEKLGINVGRYTQGKYPIMQFGLPAAACAMIMSAPKETRKTAMKELVPGIFSSMIMGITEPIEFAFLYQAPKLFYGFHAIMCGFSFMAMNLLGSHIPSIFSGGLIELLLLGVVPVAKGTKFWNYLLVGGLIAPIYFIVFSFFIRLLDLSTPGRSKDVEKISVPKPTVSSSGIPENIRALAIACGGWDNITNYANCATRLRYDIADKSKVAENINDFLKPFGLKAANWISDNHIQLIYGPNSATINQEMLKWKGTNLES